MSDIRILNFKGDKFVVNVGTVTNIVPNGDDECLIYFIGNDKMRVSGTIEEVAQALNEEPHEVAIQPDEVKETETFIRYNYEDTEEGIQEYGSLEELYEETEYFYHNTFSDEEDYDSDKEFRTLVDCIDLWEGNGYGIARVLKGRY